MGEENRKTGIDVIGDAPWGTHFCQFYQTKEDLIDVLVPYFKAGLENNEFCMWVTSEPLSEEEAEKAMKKAVANFDRYLKRGQIEIVPHVEWYLKDGAFNLQRVLNVWVDKLNQALAKGYDGIRVTGNAAWLEKNDWRNFVDYEEEINDAICKYRMIAICTYSLDKCGASEVIDVVRNHQFALIKRKGEWELIESSERKRAEEALRGSEEKFRNIFESANDCMALLDRSGRILDVNEKAVEVFGGSKEELLGKHFARLGVLSPRDIPTIMSAFAKVLAGKQPTLNSRIKNKRGQEIPLECSASLMKTHDKFAGVMVIARDVAERKKAEERIRASEERYRNLVELAPDSIMTFNLKGVIISCNTASARMSGYSKDELVGKHFSKIGPIRARDIPKYLKMLPSTVRGKVPKPFEVIYHHKNGTPGFGEVRMGLIKEGDKMTGFQAIMRDVTERKRMENELKRHSEHLEELVEERTRQLKESHEQLLKSERLVAIGELATMVGHDLRNPLQSIENATYYLNNELPRLSPSTSIPQKALEMLQVINDSVNYADRIIRDLQDFSATKKLKLKKTDINAIVKETLSQVEAPENVELITELRHLPKIKVDKDMLKRVFLNLAVNGIEAMEKGGTLKASTQKTKDFVEVGFKDTGIGMSKENMEKLFTPFFTTKAKGMGMGLAICKKFVDAHGGSIEAESEEGKGSTFTVKLPIQQNAWR